MDNIITPPLTDEQLALIIAEKMAVRETNTEKTRDQILQSANIFLKWLRNNKS